MYVFLFCLVLSKSQQCPDGQGISPSTNECIVCPEGAIINETTQYCQCEYGKAFRSNECIACSYYKEGYNPLTFNCQYCASFQGIDPETLMCSKCSDGYGIDPNTKFCGLCETDAVAYSGSCSLCYGNQIKDEITKKCICPKNQAFAGEYNRTCVPCPPGYAINGYDYTCAETGVKTGYCYDKDTQINRRPDNNNNEAIDYDTGKCVQCPEGAKARDSSPRVCQCLDYNLGINENFQCSECNEGEGISRDTYKCGKCEPGYGIRNKYCSICNDYSHPNEGIDHDSRNCRVCTENECINGFTGECQEIPTGVIKGDDNLCQCANSGYGLDSTLSSCIECQPSQGINKTTYKCNKCQFLYGIDSTSRKCDIYEDGSKCINGFNGEWKDLPEDQSINNLNNVCMCKNGGFNEQSKSCAPCNDDEGIEIATGLCKKCPAGQIKDTKTGFCVCDKKGFDEEYGECVDCKMGIDPINLHCREIEYGECINPYDKRYKEISQGQEADWDTKYCKCIENYGFEPETGNCVRCGDSQKGVGWKDSICQECVNGLVYDESIERCVCTNNKGFNADYTECIECLPKQGIDPETRQCRNYRKQNYECINGTNFWITSNFYFKIDPITYKCICDYGYLNPTTNKCEICPDGQCADPINNKCLEIKNGYSIDPSSGQCIQCTGEYNAIDDETKVCKCIEGYGKVKETGECVNCSEVYVQKVGMPYGIYNGRCEKCDFYASEGIDPDTKQCIHEGYSNAVDFSTGRIYSCLDGSTLNQFSRQCECSEGRGYDSEKQICVTCEQGEGIDTFTGKCRQLNNDDEIIDTETKKIKCKDNKGFNSTVNPHCVQCPYPFGINPSNFMCYDCDLKNQVISFNTGLCTSCMNEGAIKINKKCYQCNIGEIADLETGKCTKCPEGTTVYKNKCICPENGYGYDPIKNECVQCKLGEGVDKSTYECSKCGIGYGISSDGTCSNLYNDQCIDRHNGTIRNRKYYEYIDSFNKKCTCNSKNGYDADTKMCYNCGIDKAIDWVDGSCITSCPEGTELNTKIGRCICKNNKAFDPEYTQCIDCPAGTGIDKESYQCVAPKINEKCINRVTKFIISIPEKQYTQWDTGLCTCDYGLAYDMATGECMKCNDNEIVDNVTNLCIDCPSEFGTDWFTGKCKECIGNYVLDEKTHKCVCSNKKGFDPITHDCVSCKVGQGIDPTTMQCTTCSNDQCIDQVNGQCISIENGLTKDPNDNSCKCDVGYGYDSVNMKCEICQPGEGISPSTSECIQCESNECIDWFTGLCKDQPSDQQKDENKKCVCKEKQGYDSKTHECKECAAGEGINPSTQLCEKCPEGQCIDRSSGKCTQIVENQNKDANGLCTCNEGLGYNKTTNKCEVCGYGFGIISETNLCGPCSAGEGINKNKICGQCPDKEGIDSESGECKACEKFEGINQTTKICETCQVRQGINPTTMICEICDFDNRIGINKEDGFCTKCGEDEGIDLATGYCTTCEGGSILNPNTGICECPGNQGFSSDTHECINCKDKEGIDPETLVCGPCKIGQGINSANNRCSYCQKGEGINVETRICGKCGEREGIDWFTGECTLCSANQIIDTDTMKCVCKDKFGFNSDHECVECQQQYGVDPETLECKLCSDDYCIDRTNGKCISYTDEYPSKNSESFYCNCMGGYGFNPTTNQCEKCDDPNRIHPKTNQCINCKINEIFNQSTYSCEQCPDKQGIDSTTKTCVKCKDEQGINPITGYCEKCGQNEGIDPNTLLCGVCQQGFGVDPSTSICTKCSDSQCTICNSNFKVCEFCTDKYSVNDGVCVQDEIPIATPEPKPTPNEATTTVSGDKITITTPETETETKNYFVNIDDTDKTIVVEDTKQSNLELVIGENVNKVTIQTKTENPVDLVVNYDNTNNENDQTPVIVIDESESTSNASLKGKGQVKIENNNEGEDINLNEVVPNLNGQITIDSQSKVTVKKIDLYGNSKVDFVNTDKKAVVNLVTVQQKASTELNNVIIEGEVKAGLSSRIAVTESVDLSDATIELTSLNNKQNNNPIFVGDLTSAPNNITIVQKNVNDILESDVFTIAESYKDKFDCSKWAKKFNPSPNSVFNNAECVDSNDGKMIRLVGNHKNDDGKGGLAPGIIAAIVIVVVVVVAAVILLVYFFVIRKRRAESVSEENTEDNDQVNL